MPGQEFERLLVHSFNNYFDLTGIHAIAYRHYQMRYQPQLFDVLVDSRANELYLALECKSVDTSSVPGLYFKKHFSWKNGICQVARETDWLTQSGRNGFLVVEARRPKPYKHCAFFVPWRVVHRYFVTGKPIIPSDHITSCPSCEKRGGAYTFDDDFMEEMVKYLDSYPKNSSAVIPKKWRKHAKEV